MDEMNLDALDSLEVDEAVLEEKRNGGGEVLEASDECEGGACKI